MPEAYRTLLEQGVAKNHFPGASTAIVMQEKAPILYHVGYRVIEPNMHLLENNTIYDVASLTKVLATTTLVMYFIEQGVLALDMTVQSVLPWFRHGEIRLEHLLTHTSGLPADLSDAKSLASSDDVFRRVKEIGLVASVSSQTIYSDIGFILLGWVLEKVSEMPLNQLAERFVFGPLGMHDTSYRPNLEHTAPTEYRQDTVYQGLLHGKVHDEKAFAMGGIAGHAGLFSTAADIARFMQAMLTANFVLHSETIAKLFSPCTVADGPMRRPVPRALGWDRATPGGTAGDAVAYEKTLVHTGFTGCNLFIDQLHGVGFVLLSNAVHPYRTCNKIHAYRNPIGSSVMTELRRHYDA